MAPKTDKTEVKTEAPDEVAIKAAADEARADALFAALTEMKDEDDSIWEPNGMPKLSYLSALLGGEPVTMEEIGKIIDSPGDIQRRLVSPEDSDEDATPETKEATRLAKLAKSKPVVQMDKTVLTPEVVASTRARMAELESEIAEKTKAIQATTESRMAAQKERDILLARVATLDSNSHSETVKAYQASEHRANEQRAADMAAFRKMTGGVNPSTAATQADVNRFQRRALRRRLGA